MFLNKITAICLGLFLFHSVSAATPSEEERSDDLSRKLILHYINEYRTHHHLTPLTLNDTISSEATQHSAEMAYHKIPFGHQHFNQRIKRIYTKLGECKGGAENVAFYKINAKRLVDGWIASRGHRRNIEGHYNLTGIGIVHDKPGWAYYTQIFVLKT